MGLRCLCGVTTTPAVIGTADVFFADNNNIPTRGVVTINTDACSDTLNLGTASITFVATFEPTRNFVFTSINITSVLCTTFGEDCRVDVSGTGLVTGENTPRPFTIGFVDRPGLQNDLAFFLIEDFAATTFFEVPPGLFTLIGCPTTP